jgi:hypothetical protein
MIERARCEEHGGVPHAKERFAKRRRCTPSLSPMRMVRATPVRRVAVALPGITAAPSPAEHLQVADVQREPRMRPPRPNMIDVQPHAVVLAAPAAFATTVVGDERIVASPAPRWRSQEVVGRDHGCGPFRRMVTPCRTTPQQPGQQQRQRRQADGDQTRVAERKAHPLSTNIGCPAHHADQAHHLQRHRRAADGPEAFACDRRESCPSERGRPTCSLGDARQPGRPCVRPRLQGGRARAFSAPSIHRRSSACGR